MRTAVMEITGNGPPTKITLNWIWQPLGEDLTLWTILPGYIGNVTTGTWDAGWLSQKLFFYDSKDDEIVATAYDMPQISFAGYPLSDMQGLTGEFGVHRRGGTLYSGNFRSYWKLLSV